MTHRYFFPVYGHDEHRQREVLAVFFESGDAETFAMHPEREGFEKRNVYLSTPRTDRREHGYRPVEKPSGYQEWLASLEPKHVGGGRYQVAA